MLTVARFTDLNDVLRRANDTQFGLGASVWTRDLNKAHWFIENFRAGTVWVNTHAVLDIAVPFGGVKQVGSRSRTRRGGDPPPHESKVRDHLAAGGGMKAAASAKSQAAQRIVSPQIIASISHRPRGDIPVQVLKARDSTAESE